MLPSGFRASGDLKGPGRSSPIQFLRPDCFIASRCRAVFSVGDDKICDMPDPEHRPLDYATPVPRRDFSLRWVAFSFVLLQVFWIVPGMFWSMDLLAWGQPKQPFHDLCADAIIVVPSFIAIVISPLDCSRQMRRNGRLRDCWPSIVSFLMALLCVGWMIYEWVQEDVVMRNIPRDIF